MRRKLVSSLLCMMMMCTVCTPAYADEAVTADTSVTTEVATTESTTATVTTTAAQKKVQKIDKKAKKTNTKKKKKKASKNSNKKDSSFVQEAPKKKITFVVKKTQGQLEKLVKEKRAAADQIKEKKSEKKEYQEKLQKIQNFYTQWNYGSYIGIQTSSDQSLDNLNDPADQTIKQLADNLNDTGLIQASMNYHFGLQDQKNILIMMDSQDSIDLQPIIEKKNLHFSLHLEEKDIWGYMDFDKIDKVLYNILSNAAKYTPADKKVELNVSTLQKDNSRFLRIEVQDEGIGIDQKEISKIFTPFYVNKTAYAPQSNGVGLSLTKKLVTLHKGDIQVESSIGEGSRFTVLIPIDRNYYPEIKDIIETSEIPSTVPNEATEDTEEKEDTILLVDDNEEFLLLMKRKLATHYNILTATNGKKALEIVRQ